MTSELLGKLPYWEHLTEEEKHRIREKASVRHYEPGEQLYGPCVDCVGMIHMLSGEARAYILSDEGRK